MPRHILRKLTGKEYIYLLESGNEALKTILHRFNIPTYIPDQGGWITYKQYPKVCMEFKTVDGLIEPSYLKKLRSKTNFLVNSLAGYFVAQPMQAIQKICKLKRINLINDVSGSIGTGLEKYGDFIVGSFGKWKPVNNFYGGFIATDRNLNLKETFDEEQLPNLRKALDELPKRLEYIHTLSSQIKEDLKGHDILYKNQKSLVVIVKYETQPQKNKILKYCKDKSLPYTLCPRYIRVNSKAVSIEVKRL